jgi:hypothetical protein
MKIMIFGEGPAFDFIIDKLHDLEDEVNHLPGP